jgi:hypothetical protein
MAGLKLVHRVGLFSGPVPSQNPGVLRDESTQYGEAVKLDGLIGEEAVAFECLAERSTMLMKQGQIRLLALRTRPQDLECSALRQRFCE